MTLQTHPRTINHEKGESSRPPFRTRAAISQPLSATPGTAGANFTVRLAISDQDDAPGLQKAARLRHPRPLPVDPGKFPGQGRPRDGTSAPCWNARRLNWSAWPATCAWSDRYCSDKFPGRILNIHPALLPSFPGLHAQSQALRHGVKISGCTVHFVDAGTGQRADHRPAGGAESVPTDNEDTLSRRILRQEHRLYPAGHPALFSPVACKSKAERVIIGDK